MSKIAATDADVIFSDKVISMNDRVDKIKKLNHFKKFKINQKLMRQLNESMKEVMVTA